MEVFERRCMMLPRLLPQTVWRLSPLQPLGSSSHKIIVFDTSIAPLHEISQALIHDSHNISRRYFTPTQASAGNLSVMFLRSVDALKTSRAVSGRPTLVRFLKIAKKTNPGAKRLWPTGPAMKYQKIPIRNEYQPRSSELPIPVSVFIVPNNSTAYTRWPTLLHFRPTLQPRAWRTVKHGGKKVSTVGEQIMCLPYLYHDLGIMIYEGPDKNQTEIMANILSRVVGHEGRMQPRDWTLPALIKVPFEKWNVYRMPVDRETHIDRDKSVREDPRLKRSR